MACITHPTGDQQGCSATWGGLHDVSQCGSSAKGILQLWEACMTLPGTNSGKARNSCLSDLTCPGSHAKKERQLPTEDEVCGASHNQHESIPRCLTTINSLPKRSINKELPPLRALDHFSSPISQTHSTRSSFASLGSSFSLLSQLSFIQAYLKFVPPVTIQYGILFFYSSAI